ncbi:winged helix-turn-helix domain-containing protein [Kumtagia ephedrae]|uniref:OmpR/PhoB-type domain-containing protein n=1 Tax=Kumtagia ephedrae TaxID=2116701 RepID=A0A2P7S0Z7_9HYPH|nr:winged helix-turn-helix domain-containing protein [Mesorhizobium ephedrae]PSJ56145.1 hypothetical protein C7I84_21480 [Mesorhizobium ephedrae]
MLSRDRLSQLAHSRDLYPGDRSIDIRITRLRKKIEFDPDKPRVLLTVRSECRHAEGGGTSRDEQRAICKAPPQSQLTLDCRRDLDRFQLSFRSLIAPRQVP